MPFLLARALRRAACHVDLQPTDRDLPGLAEIGLAAGGFGDPVYRQLFNRRVLKRIRATRPDVVFVYGSNWSLQPPTLYRLRHDFGCQLALWEVNGEPSQPGLEWFHHVFALDSAVASDLRTQGLACAEHLPACADPQEHRPMELTAEQRLRLGGDVCFVGSPHPLRNRLLRELGELGDLDLRIWGRGWSQVDGLRPQVRDEPVYGLKKNMIYHASRLSLNVQRPHMRRGENFRVFEVAACGGVSLSLPKPDLARCFTPGEEVATFDGPAELPRRARQLLAAPDWLATLRDGGRRRVLAEHTYDHRAAVILEHLHGCH